MEKLTAKTVQQMLLEATKGYPEQYFDFSSGVDIGNSVICHRIIEGFEQAKNKIIDKQLDEAHFAISSGNCKVFGEIYKQENGLYTVFINVCKHYQKKSFIDIKII